MNPSSHHVNLNYNDRCLVDNPLKDKLPDELDREATIFANKCHASASLFKRAARIAQDPIDWRTVPGVTTDEANALDKERTARFWQQTKTLQVTVASLCFSAIIQGWTQTGINGANQTWPEQFNLIDPQSGRLIGDSSRWIFAGVNAVTFLAAGVFGCWLSDPLQGVVLGSKDHNQKRRALLGRRGAIFISGCICLAALVGSACCHTWRQFLGCRALLGIGLGAKASVTTIFGAEVSPSHLRGALVMNWQLFDTLGIFLGFTANLILFRVGPLSWRFQVASACLPTICLLTLIWVIPESPRWLLKQGRLAEAFDAMCQLRETPLQAAREIFYANAQLQIEVSLLPQKLRDQEGQNMSKGATHIEDANELSRSRTEVATMELTQYQERVRLTHYWTRIWQLFRNPRTRRATMAAAVVMISQQLCGVNILIFYSNTFFNDTGNPNNDHSRAAWMSWGVGLANFLFTIPAYYGIERSGERPGGRRFLLLATYPCMTLTMMAACLSFLHPDENTRFALIGLWLFLFVLLYSLGQGPVAFAYSAEVFPLVCREAGMSFAVFVNFVGAGLLTLLVPLSQTTKDNQLIPNDYGIGQSRLLAVFIGFNVLALVLIFLFVPETAMAVIPRHQGQLIPLSLEELNYVFGVPTLMHIRYQVTVMIPWGMHQCRWLVLDRFRGSGPPRRPPKLYRWVERAARRNQETEMSEIPAVEEPNLRQRQTLGDSRGFDMAGG